MVAAATEDVEPTSKGYQEKAINIWANRFVVVLVLYAVMSNYWEIFKPRPGHQAMFKRAATLCSGVTFARACLDMLPNRKPVCKDLYWAMFG